MAATPGITLTASLQDVSGNAVANGILRITLCGYGQVLPHVSGTSMIAAVDAIERLATGSTTNIKLWGNDQISPPGTFYAISLEDAHRNIVQSGNYVFTGVETIDLSTAQQIDVPVFPMLSNLQVGVTVFVGNTILLELPQTPTMPLIYLSYNGNFQRPGIDYTLSGNTITLQFVAQAGDNLIYAYIGTQPAAGLVVPNPQLTNLQTETLLGVGNTFHLSKSSAFAFLLGLFYNGSLLVPGGVHYTFTLPNLVTLNFAVQNGDNLYALYYSL